MNILKNKVTLITGASRGIGFATAKSFEKEGAQLALTARKNLEILKEFKSANAYKLDLLDQTVIQDLIKSVVRDFGRIDVLVNNASVFKQTNFEDITAFELNNIIKANFEGVFLLTQEVFKHMKQQKSGKIINITSVAAQLGSGRAAHYASAKAAQVSFTKSIAKLGGSYNINVNAVAPGFIETDMIESMLRDRREDIEASIPLAKVGTPDDVAGLVVFLASNNSNYITGQTICVDGGFCMI